jgi:DNA-binding SARP family transcriptional activator
MEFGILGPLWVTHDRIEITPSAPKVRQVLAFLLVRAQKIVPVWELIDELWGNKPPKSAMTTLQTYIYKLRKDVLDRCPPAAIRTTGSGYLLDVSPEAGDLLRFGQLAAAGRAAMETGDPRRAVDLMTEALALWRGPMLADVETGNVLSAHVTRIEEERIGLLELRIRTDLQLGRHLMLISELKALVSRYPLHEPFHAQLMLALQRSGRRHEALETYRRLRSVLKDELGLDPSSPVQKLSLSLLGSC